VECDCVNRRLQLFSTADCSDHLKQLGFSVRRVGRAVEAEREVQDAGRGAGRLRRRPAEGRRMLGYLLLALELALLALATYTGRRRILKALNSSPKEENLDGTADVDEQILNYLRARGGLAYQGDIVKDLYLPKSTVHKAVRRLAERGLVEVRRQGRINIVALRGPAQQQPS
jgi:Uncharacterized membrane-associated protein/domain